MLLLRVITQLSLFLNLEKNKRRLKVGYVNFKVSTPTIAPELGSPWDVSLALPHANWAGSLSRSIDMTLR